MPGKAYLGTIFVVLEPGVFYGVNLHERIGLLPGPEDTMRCIAERCQTNCQHIARRIEDSRLLESKALMTLVMGQGRWQGFGTCPRHAPGTSIAPSPRIVPDRGCGHAWNMPKWYSFEADGASRLVERCPKGSSIGPHWRLEGTSGMAHAVSTDDEGLLSMLACQKLFRV